MEAKDSSQDMETINKKTHYMKSKGQTISVDYFFFNCLEEEKTMRALGLETIGKSHPQLTEILEEANDIKEIMTILVSWYKEEYPQLSASKNLDIQAFAVLVQEFNSLKLDIESVFNKLTGKTPPRNSEAEEEKEIWSHIDQLLLASFPSYCDLMIKYFDWSYKKHNSQARDLKSVPPVGQYMFLLKREFGNSSFWGKRPSPFSNSSQRSGNYGRSTGSRYGNQNNYNERSRPNKFNKDRHEKKPSEQEAMKEVVDAIKRLEADPSLSEITLKAQNSFLRRLQHKKVADLNFSSSSVGEGNNRAIKIKNSQ